MTEILQRFPVIPGGLGNPMGNLGCVDICDTSRPQSQTVIPAKAGIQTPAVRVSTVTNTPDCTVRLGMHRTGEVTGVWIPASAGMAGRGLDL